MAARIITPASPESTIAVTTQASDQAKRADVNTVEAQLNFST
jgi:hypothetical protein